MKARHQGFVLLIFCCLADFLSAGDLSYSKCPASFDLSTANTTNDDSILLSKRGSSLFGSYLTSQGTSRVENIVVTGNSTDLNTYLLVLSIPFILFALLFLVGFCTMIICCTFDRSCPPCQGWRRDYSKEPYKKSELRVVAIFAIIFCIGVCVTTIIAFTALPDMKTAMDNTKCGLYMTLDATKNGDSSTGWGGVDSLSSQIGNISNSLDTAVTNINSAFTINQWLIDDISSQMKTNINLYKKYANNTLASPDPNTTSDINSLFIATGLGPNGTANTLVSDIDSGLAVTNKLSVTAYSVDQAAKILVDSKTQVQNNVKLSLNQMNMYSVQLTKFQSQLDTFSTAQFDQNFSYLLYTVEGVLGFTLVASLLGLLGVFATHIFDIYNCRMMVHLSWIVFGFSYLGVILLTFLFVPGGSVGYQTCNYFGKALTNQTQFQKLKAYYSQNVINKIEQCLFGDGNILKTFNAYSDLLSVTTLFTNIDSYTDMITPTNSKYVDLSIAYTKISTWITTTQKYRDGIQADSNTIQTNDRNPQYSLKSLNKYTLQAVNGQNCTQDYWVFDNSHCISGYLVYSPGVTTTTGITLTTSPLCISFNQAIAQGREKWTQTDFGSRYVQIAQACSASYPIIVNYGNALIRYRDSRIKLFQGLVDDLSDLLQTNTDYNQNLLSFKNKVSSFSTSVSTLKDLVSSKLTGLSITSNCTVIASDLFFVRNSLCTSFMGQAVKIGLCVSLLCVFMIGAIISGYIFALRYSRIEKEMHISPQLEESQVDSEGSIDSNS